MEFHIKGIDGAKELSLDWVCILQQNLVWQVEGMETCYSYITYGTCTLAMACYTVMTFYHIQRMV
jgi:hypothetical protein